MASQRELIRDRAVELLRESPDGLRFAELRDAVRQYFPSASVGSLSHIVSRLAATRSGYVDRPRRGFFRFRSAQEAPDGQTGGGPSGRSKKERVRDKAVELLKAAPQGLRYGELRRAVAGFFPGTTPGTIAGYVWNLHVKRADDVYKPEKGLFKHKLPGKPPAKPGARAEREEDFYAPFAEWIKRDLGECTEAVAFGGHYLSKKWGTPDVVGVYKPSLLDPVKFEPEIVSAEIKIRPTDPVTAFGQAIAYRLFSSKVYLVEPKTLTGGDLKRIEALCTLFGVGLVLFSPDPQRPDFAIRVRAQKYSPDMSYVNDFARQLNRARSDVFRKLFG